MDDHIEVTNGDSAAETIRLAAHWAHPAGARRVPGIVLSHGFPQPPRGRIASGLTFPGLADRIAKEVGCHVLTFNFRGTGGSDGDFSISGWMADLRAAIDQVAARPDVSEIWLIGAGFGGSISICCAADDSRVRGVATIAAHSNLNDWLRDPARFLTHARRMGVFRSADAPSDVASWTREIKEFAPLAAASKLGDRPLLILHGSDDTVVAPTDAIELSEAHGSADIRFVFHAGHRLRHDPRAVATLLGWLDRQGGPLLEAAPIEPSELVTEQQTFL
ncbi:Alpha/beta hydrolase family [Actinobacteria bacterium IMCC26256]|nr:Alpha/beta hydrolase family [Actinobacteria bacterium IMCC26256]